MRDSRKLKPEIWFFLRFFMLANGITGAFNFITAGLANIGDIAIVMNGWEPNWLWRVLVAIIGYFLLTVFIWLALDAFSGRLEMQRNWWWIAIAIIFAFVLGRTLCFECPTGHPL